MDAPTGPRRPILGSRPADPIPSGQRAGDYELLAQIPTSGLEVFVGHRLSRFGFLHRAVIKRALRSRPDYAACRRRLFEEARAYAFLSHPGIVRLYDLGEDEGASWLAREHVDGVELAAICAELRTRGEALPFALACFMVTELLRALHHAHTASTPDGRPLEVIHSSLSPASVLLGRTGHLSLIDFGHPPFERALDPQAPPRTELPYLAPEVLQSRPGDAHSDVYAAGLILFELLTGRPCFKGRTTQELLPKIARGELRLERLEREGVAPELRDVVERATQLLPARRFGSAQEMANALDGYVVQAGLQASSWMLSAFCQQHGLLPAPILTRDPVPAPAPEARPSHPAPARDDTAPPRSIPPRPATPPPPPPPLSRPPAAATTQPQLRPRSDGADEIPVALPRRSSGPPHDPSATPPARPTAVHRTPAPPPPGGGPSRAKSSQPAPVALVEPTPLTSDDEGLRSADARTQPEAPRRPPPAPRLPTEPEPIAPPPPSVIQPHPGATPDSGDLAATRASEVVAKLVAQRATGILELRAGPLWKRLTMAEGAALSIHSNMGMESIGEQLVRAKLIQRYDLDRALRESPRGEEGVVDRLLEMQVMEPARLAVELGKNIADGLTETFGWRSGSFEYRPLPVEPPKVRPEVDLLLLISKDPGRIRSRPPSALPSRPPEPVRPSINEALEAARQAQLSSGRGRVDEVDPTRKKR